ncbi:MAG: CoA-transferase [Woeseiaceae bacterium]|nr:CoA-transferase [Woeseiaceae bacterium]
MIDKKFSTAADAVSDIPDGAIILVGGFGAAGSPVELLHALIDQGAKDLTVINNNTGSGHVGLAALDRAGPREENDLFLPKNGRVNCISVAV